jgi:hypothetical protein
LHNLSSNVKTIIAGARHKVNTLRRKGAENGDYGLAARGVDNSRGKFEQRQKNELSFGQSWMGYDEIRLDDDPRAVKKDIDVQRARSLG